MRFDWREATKVGNVSDYLFILVHARLVIYLGLAEWIEILWWIVMGDMDLCWMNISEQSGRIMDYALGQSSKWLYGQTENRVAIWI